MASEYVSWQLEKLIDKEKSKFSFQIDSLDEPNPS